MTPRVVSDLSHLETISCVVSCMCAPEVSSHLPFVPCPIHSLKYNALNIVGGIQPVSIARSQKTQQADASLRTGAV